MYCTHERHGGTTELLLPLDEKFSVCVFLSPNYRKHLRLGLFTGFTVDTDAAAEQPLISATSTGMFHAKKDGWSGSATSSQSYQLLSVNCSFVEG